MIQNSCTYQEFEIVFWRFKTTEIKDIESNFREVTAENEDEDNDHRSHTLTDAYYTTVLETRAILRWYFRNSDVTSNHFNEFKNVTKQMQPN